MSHHRADLLLQQIWQALTEEALIRPWPAGSEMEKIRRMADPQTAADYGLTANMNQALREIGIPPLLMVNPDYPDDMDTFMRIRGQMSRNAVEMMAAKLVQEND